MPTDIERRRARLRAKFSRWEPRTLGGWLEYCAGEFGDRPFVITDERTITYAETAVWATRLADGLAAVGVRPGDRVGILMANYLEFAPVKFAAAKAGAVAIPLNYLYRAEELEYVLRQSECSVLVTMTGFGDLDYLDVLDRIAPGWEEGEVAGLPVLRRVVLLSTDGRERAGVLTVPGLGELGEANPGRATDEAHPDDIGDMLYTSGTTGSPKGVLVTHDAVQRTAYASALTRAFEDERRILFSLPCYHMFGYVEGLLAAMVVGGAIIPQTAFDPVRYFEGIERHRATDVLCVPTMTVGLLEHPRREDFDLTSLSAILSGAAPAPVWLWERVRDELGVDEIVTGYGMTECGGAMTLTLPEDELTYTSVTVGRPKLAGSAGVAGRDALTEYKTIDPTTGEDLPAHVEGELASRGPTDMIGFWNKPEESAAAKLDGWIRSGDLGRVREDGYLEVTGRSKELYKSGGELVMPKEIEDLLSGHPAISQVYAIGVPDERWGDAGCVCIVGAPGESITAAEVLALCKDKLARFKVPKHVLFLDPSDLPMTPTGKVQKFRLVTWAQRRLTEPADELAKRVEA
ncbi:class I adenylate-forming enzyme family protein [Prauserella cavernicola]|uniref:AMP-binding protein n=1 Tax=Prauserella cavernicola TaxID=2800127 RepID=A0A934V735_9PSEU|nr:AMP-binding protein [Prauserella cavernicola]MBK1787299.1 AMP-binding protein [Prauserella cavernicola]